MTVFSLEISPTDDANYWLKLKQIQLAWVDIASHAASFDELLTQIRLAANIQRNSQIPVMPHLAARYLNRDKLDKMMPQLTILGIKQLMIIHGDRLAGVDEQPDFQAASDLMIYLHHSVPQINLTGACYPEAIDIDNLRSKAAAGCKQLITQAFFDNQVFYNLQDKCNQAGIRIPIVAGIMPLTRWKQVQWLTKTGGIKVPANLLSSLIKYQSDPDSLRKIGLDYAAKQIADLVDHQVRGIHLFTMNDLAAAEFLLNSYC